MLTFSDNPEIAEHQMRAIIFYLTCFGYIDGNFDRSEKTFVRNHIRNLVEKRAADAMGDADPQTRVEVVEKFVVHFHEVFQVIDQNIRALFTETVAENESVELFVYGKLKLRSYEIFRSFDVQNQQCLLDAIDKLIYADGEEHPAEVKFRNELRALLKAAAVDRSPVGDVSHTESMQIRSPIAMIPRVDNHAFFRKFEQHYSANPTQLRKQVDSDHRLMDKALAEFEKQRARGRGKLAGARSTAAFAEQSPFLDRYVYLHPKRRGVDYELTVLGDLHGCYSCLKAAIMQTDFLAKVEAFRLAPTKHPNPKLVLLGDYIDRGQFSYNGVLRTILELFTSVPEHVFVLRGNHEYYVEHRGRVYGGVKPAEAINTFIHHMPPEIFATFMRLFDSMPNMLVFDRILFVHAGIPRDATLRDKYRDLGCLNDADIRFEMMWSDPSSADYIPDLLQAHNARFPFGQTQYEQFMSRIGCTMMVRGHEKINEGFKSVYPLSKIALLNVFSAGGADNKDLPEESSYREVTPMALTVRIRDDATTVTPWEIDYRRYNDPKRNAFFASPPEIEHRLDS